MMSSASRQSRRIGTAMRGLLLMLVTLGVGPHAFAEEMPGQQHYDITLGDLLDENGNVTLPEGFSGSIDPSGFEMLSKEGEAPQFVRSSSSNDQWSEGEFGVPGCAGGANATGTINAIVVIGDELFLAGNFLACGLTPISNLARFNLMTGEFFPLGDGVNNAVHALAAIGEDLYIGGQFTQAGAATANRIAVFDTTLTGNAGFSALGDGVSNTVFDLAAIGDDLYVGGFFNQAGGIAANNIAVFDTMQTGNAGWSALGDGVGGAVFDFVLTLVDIGDSLYVGGSFSQAGGASADNIAVYDTTQPGNSGFSTLGTGVNNTVRALAGIGDDLYVGGNFSQAGGGSANHIAVYDTTQTGNAGWSALGDGVSSTVNAIATIGNDLYAVGFFTQAGGISATRIAVYDTTQSGNAGWAALGDGLNGNVFALAALSEELYVGGDFSQAGGAPASGISVYDTNQAHNEGWSALGEGIASRVRAFANSGDKLYVGGSYVQTDSVAAKNIAVFDTTKSGAARWSAFGGGVNNTIYALATIGNDLYVGGQFTDAGGTAASRIAVYDTNQTGSGGWSAVGDGVNGNVFALAAIGDALYVGGSFTEAGGEPASAIAVYDTTQSGNSGWSALGVGVNATVNALAAIGDDLYVGGNFSQAGGGAANHIAVYDTTQTGNAGWSALGDGVSSTVNAIATIGNDLYAVGFFTQAGGISATRIAVYDTTQSGNAGWAALGDGLNGNVFALAALSEELYVGGDFSQAGGVPANRIAVLDTTQTGNAGWSALGDGTSGSVFALGAIGSDLYVGGQFATAGDYVNGFFARYDTSPNQPPSARDDAFSGFEDQPLSSNVFSDNGNGVDSDPDLDSFEVQSPGTFTAGGIGGSVTILANGDFTYTPPADLSGVATFDYTIADPSGATDSATVTVTVDPVNDQPTFTAVDPAPVDEDAAPQTVAGFATFDPGAANESGQSVLAYSVSNVSDPALFGTPPSVDTSGMLSYTPADDANGTSTFDLTVRDDGGTANGGVDTSAAQTFTITVEAVNDPPTFTAGGDITGFEDTPFSQAWASAISPGPADEACQDVMFLVNATTNPALFAAGPAIDAAGQLTFTPAADTTGSADIEVIAMDDGGTPNGGDDTSDAAVFTIEVAKAADLALDKTSGSFFTPPGGVLTYELVVTNAGPSDVVDVRIEDPEPARLTFGNWQCTPTGAALCDIAVGSGPLDVLVSIPEGGSVTVTVDAQLTDTDTIPITNTATVTAPVDVTELAPADNTDSDTDLVGLFADGMESIEPD